MKNGMASVNLIGPTITIHPDGAIRYMLEGIPHRMDGPAVILPNGNRYWFRHGVCHRVEETGK